MSWNRKPWDGNESARYTSILTPNSSNGGSLESTGITFNVKSSAAYYLLYFGLYMESRKLGKLGWLWKSGAIQPKNVSSIQNDCFLFFVQFVPTEIHHRYVAQMELKNSLSPS
jgi:hypothetical protein